MNGANNTAAIKILIHENIWLIKTYCHIAVSNYLWQYDIMKNKFRTYRKYLICNPNRNTDRLLVADDQAHTLIVGYFSNILTAISNLTWKLYENIFSKSALVCVIRNLTKGPDHLLLLSFYTNQHYGKNLKFLFGLQISPEWI